MIVFELTMPNKGSWNGKWSQEGTCFARVYKQNVVPKEYWNKCFFYCWDDGWTACVSVTKVSAVEAHKIEKRSKGFCGYDWMIESIIECGRISTRKEREAM